MNDAMIRSYVNLMIEANAIERRLRLAQAVRDTWKQIAALTPPSVAHIPERALVKADANVTALQAHLDLTKRSRRVALRAIIRDRLLSDPQTPVPPDTRSA